MNRASELRILVLERVTRIELALSAWESEPSGAFTCPELRSWLSVSAREIPVLTGVNGTLMAWRSWLEPGQWPVRPSALWRSDPLLRRSVCAAGQPARPQVSRCIGLSASDREYLVLTGRSGTQRARPPWARSGHLFCQSADVTCFLLRPIEGGEVESDARSGMGRVAGVAVLPEVPAAGHLGG